MRYTNLLLILTLFLTFGCKQETELRDPRNPNIPEGIEFSGNYSPNVISPAEIINNLSLQKCPVNLPNGIDCEDVVGFGFFLGGPPIQAAATVERTGC